MHPPKGRVRCSVNIDEPIISQIRILLGDPTRGGVVGWGAFSDLVNTLLGQWLEEVKRKEGKQQC